MFDGLVNWFKSVTGQNKKKKDENTQPIQRPSTPTTQSPTLQRPQTTPLLGQNKQSSLITTPKAPTLSTPTSAQASASINKAPAQSIAPQQSTTPAIRPLNQPQQTANIQQVQQPKPLDIKPVQQPKPLDPQQAQPKPFDPQSLAKNPVKSTAEPNKGNVIDFMTNYVNPLGEHGILGRQSIAKNTKIINDTADRANNYIDKNIDPTHANGKLDSWGDVARFAAKLPVGMAQAPLTSLSDTREAITGKKLNTDNNGNITGEQDRTALQRIGAAGNAAINTFGLEYGASKTLLQSLMKNGGAKAAAAGVKNGASDAIKQWAKDSLKEGVEEGVQSYASDLQDNGKLDSGSFGRSMQNAALGVGGGALMHGAAKVNDNVRSKVDESLSNRALNEAFANPAMQSALLNANTEQSTPNIDEATNSTEAKLTRDENLPDVVNTEPQSTHEAQAAIDNGIITPATASLSVEDKVQTALNSRIGVQYRQQRALSEPTNLNTTTNTQTGTNTQQTAPSEATQAIAPQMDQQTQAAATVQPGLSPDQSINDPYIQQPLSSQQSYDQLAAADNPEMNIPTMPGALATQYRVGDPNGTTTRSDMQNIQLENNRMFGDQSPNVQFADDIRTDDGRMALGATTDTANGPSKIQLLRQQGDPQATYFHESVHKALNDYMTQEERTQVLMSYATDQRIDSSISEEQIEEMMSDDFIQYVAARKNDSFKKPSIAQQVRDIFEKVFRRIQYVVAKRQYDGTLTQDYLQFYNDLYGGKFATEQVIDKDIRDGATPEQLALQDHRDTLQQQWENTQDQGARRTIAQQIAALNQQIGQARKEGSALNAASSYRASSLRPDANAPRSTSEAADESRLGGNIANYPRIFRGERRFKLSNATPRHPAVSLDEITSPRLREKGAVLTKTDFNNALDEVVAEKNPDLYEAMTILDGELQYLEDSDIALGGAIRPEDARHLFGDKYTEWVPRNFIRKDALPLDIQAQERGFSDPDEYVEHIMKPLDIRKQIANAKSEVAKLYSDPSLRSEAKALAEERALAKAKESAKPAPKTRADIEKAMADIEERATDDLPDDQMDALSREYDSLAQSLSEVDNRSPTPKPEQQEATNPPVVHKTNIPQRDAETGIARGFDLGPRKTVNEIVEATAKESFMPTSRVREMVEKYAKEHGYDISSGRPIRQSTTVSDLSIVDADGNLKPIDEIQPSDSVLNQIHKPGIEHAIPANSSLDGHDQTVRQMVYKDEDGNAVHFFEFRGVNGKWHKVGDTPIKSMNAGVRIKQLYSDATVNAEAKRAYDSGVTAQYIWRENDKGNNFVTNWDAAIDGADDSKAPSYKLVQYNPEEHYIDSGRVVDAASGKILGNYVEITPDATKVYAGHKLITLDHKDLDFSKANRVGLKGGITLTTQDYLRQMFSGRRSYKGTKNQLEYQRGEGNKTEKALLDVMVNQPQQAMANMAKEAAPLAKAIDEYERKVNHSVPKKQRAAFMRDIVFTAEPEVKWENGKKVTPPTYEKRLEVLRNTYGDRAAKEADKYLKFMKSMYDNLLVRMNMERRAQGKPEIKRRSDYITHIGQELDHGVLANIKSALTDVNNLMGGDVSPTWRSNTSLPAHLTGKTEDRKPRSKYNPFTMKRLADNKPLDPFTPLRLYAEVGLHNIHLSQSIDMGRAIETSIRGLSAANEEYQSPRGLESMYERTKDLADSVKNGHEMNKDDVDEYSKKLFGLSTAFKDINTGNVQRLLRKQKARGGKLNNADQKALQDELEELSKSIGEKAQRVESFNEQKESAEGMQQLVGFVQEHTNLLAGKTEASTRVTRDLEGDSGLIDKGMREMQKAAALSMIVGNVNTAVTQVAAVPMMQATTPIRSQVWALKHMNDKEMEAKSAALYLRYAKSDLRKKSKFDKAMEKGGSLTEAVERAAMNYMFAAKYHQAIQKGLDERKAIKFAETFASDTTGWRDAASSARIYNKPLLGSALQFTREVTQQYRGIWNTMNKREKARWMVANGATLTMMGLLTGNKIGIDPLGAMFETAATAAGAGDDDDDDNNPWSKAGRIAQIWLRETVAGVPIVSGISNLALSQDQRKTIFGNDSDLGKYDGQLAAFTSLGNTIKGASNLASGNTDQAWKDFLKVLPMGGQMQKTAAGLQAMSRGYTKTSTGKIRTAVNQDNPLNWLAATLFGPNAIIEQRKSFDGGKALSKDDSDIANTLSGDQKLQFIKSMSSASNGTAGLPYGLKSALDAMGANKANASEGPATVATSADQVKETAKMDKKVAKGKAKKEDGLYYTEDGTLQRSYYKDMAKASTKQDDATYQSYLYGYGLEGGTKYDKVKDKGSSGGSDLIKKLNDTTESEKGSDVAGSAVSLFKGSGDYKDVPDWVKKRFYKESGYTDKQIQYGALASYKADVKLDAYYRPIAKEADHQTLLNELWKGRTKSIYKNGYLGANDTIITALQKEGYLSKDEAKRLKSVKLDEKGNEVESTSSSSSRSGSKSSSQFQKDLISKYLSGSQDKSSQDMASILKKYMGTSFSTGSVSSRSPSMRSLRKRRGSSSVKREKTVI